jgi:HK97 family phage major capsid protein
MTIKEMREQRKALGDRANAILSEAAKTQGRMTSEQETEFDRIHTDVEALGKQLERMEKQEQLNRELASAVETPEAPAVERSGEVKPEERKHAFEAWARKAQREYEPTDEERSVAKRAGINLNSDKVTFRMLPTGEMRALTTQTGSSGGNTIPTSFVHQLEAAQIAVSSVRGVSDVIRTSSGEALTFPTADDTANTGAILAENTQFTTSTDPTFSTMTLNAYTYYSKPVLVPIQLLQDTGVDLESYIAKALGIRIGRAQNAHYTTGDNSSKPNGIVSASTAGKTAAGAATVTFPELVDLEHSVDPYYRNSVSCRYMFKDSTLQIIKKLVDSSSRPLWQAGLNATFANGAPDTINGYRYVINQDMPAMTTGLKSILFGDFSYYKVREVLDFTLLRLNERYADFLQVAFVAFLRSDGDLLDAGQHPVRYLIQA